MANLGPSASSIVILFLVSGFFYTFSYKLQGSQMVNEGTDGSIIKTFFHPYMQGVTFFVGESLCVLLIYLQRAQSQKPKPYRTKIFIIPAISDLFSVMLQCTALALISGSTFMMLKGASIVTTLVFSHWLIDFEVRSRHAVGCALAVLGLAIVGLADIYLADTKGVTSSDNLHTIGYVLMVVSLIFNGFLYAYEQKLLKEYKVSPLEMVGWEGVYGTVLSLLLVTVLCLIPCPYTGNKCVYDSQSRAFIELPSVYLRQVFTSLPLFLLVIAGLVSNAFYNFYGVTITQTMDSLTRSLLNVCRTGLIWLVGIIITAFVGQESPYKIESLKFSVNFVKLVGFSCIIVGTLVYNRILFDSQMARLDLKIFQKTQTKEMEMKLVNKQQEMG